MRMRRPRPSTLVCRSLEGFLTTFELDRALLLLEGGETRADCMEMEPMKGPWGWLDPGVDGSG